LEPLLYAVFLDLWNILSVLLEPVQIHPLVQKTKTKTNPKISPIDQKAYPIL